MGDRVIITMACTECKNRNYYFARGKKQEGKLEIKKFCRTCGKHSLHKETKSFTNLWGHRLTVNFRSPKPALVVQIHLPPFVFKLMEYFLEDKTWLFLTMQFNFLKKLIGN